VDRRAKVELFEEIRREYEFGVATIQGIAKKLGVHRRLVRQALASAVPPERKRPVRKRPVLGELTAFIDAVLEADRRAPRKQRHTARRIWKRIQVEMPEHRVGESTIRQYVRQRKRELGVNLRETCIPQQYDWGQEAQADWYEAAAELGGERVTLQVFSMRSMASGAAFHRAYLRATQQAFLEAHELAFAYFGGVFRTVRYDNLKSAVKRILRGSRREETTRFIAFRSHWRFESVFCTPGEGHEKGGVEGEVGYFRRNVWVPVPKANDVDELNALLATACEQEQRRVISGRSTPVRVAMLEERQHLLAAPEEGFDLMEVSWPKVDGLGRVRVRTNWYSAPAKAGSTVQARVSSTHVEIWNDGACIARHERCYGHQQQILDLEHYLDVLEHKPGALAGSKPLAAWREKGLWPPSFDQLWDELRRRHGASQGTRLMIQLIGLGKKHGYDRLREAVESCISAGCWDPAAITHSLTMDALERPVAAPIEVESLLHFERPMPTVLEYDRLLSTEVQP
jgi:transposase